MKKTHTFGIRASPAEVTVAATVVAATATGGISAETVTGVTVNLGVNATASVIQPWEAWEARPMGVTDVSLARYVTVNSLRLDCCQITDKGLIHLYNIPRLHLDIPAGYDGITDEALRALAKSPGVRLLVVYYGGWGTYFKRENPDTCEVRLSLLTRFL